MGQRSSRRIGWAALALLAGPGIAPLPGCGFVPRSRLDDAARLVQGLRTENAQLKDANLGLKTQNQDLAQRAVDDARAIEALEATNAQYERSIAEYQDDRQRMRAAFGDLKDSVRPGSPR